MEWLAPMCTNSRCPNPMCLEIDHRDAWAAVKETKLDNLDGLCEVCHDRKTHHGWTLDEGHGRRPLRSPEERARAGPSPPPDDPPTTEASHGSSNRARRGSRRTPRRPRPSQTTMEL